MKRKKILLGTGTAVQKREYPVYTVDEAQDDDKNARCVNCGKLLNAQDVDAEITQMGLPGLVDRRWWLIKCCECARCFAIEGERPAQAE